MLTSIRRRWDSVLDIGRDPSESDLRRGVRRIVVGYLVIGGATRVVAAAVQFSEGIRAGWVDFSAMVASFALLAVLALRPAWFYGIVNVALGFILVEVLSATVLGGGLIGSEMVILFGLLAVIGALIALRVIDALWWFLAFLATVVLGVVLPNWIEPLEEVGGTAEGIAFTVFGVTVFVFLGMAYFVRQRNRFQQESDDLLHNILPADIATRLKRGERPIADRIDEVSVLVADIVGFTPMSERVPADTIVATLDRLFSRFDDLTEELGLEKYQTVGDSYLVLGGLGSDGGQLPQVADLALAMRTETPNHAVEGFGNLQVRIGIHSGPVLAGVIGKRKFSYEVWGDTINTASRMESTGIAGKIQVTAHVYEQLADRYRFEHRGDIEVKGKGAMPTYLLEGRHADRPGQ